MEQPLWTSEGRRLRWRADSCPVEGRWWQAGDLEVWSVLVLERVLDLAGLPSLRGGGRAQLGGEDPVVVGLFGVILED